MTDPYLLSYAERMDALLAHERRIAELQAEQLRLLEALRRDPLPEPLGKEFVREDVRLTLRWSEGLTRDRFACAKALCGPLTATLAALQAGEINYPQAEAIAAATYPLSDEAGAELQAAALAFARTRDLAATRRKITRELLRLAPEEQKRACLAARDQRAVWSQPDGLGMSRVGGLLPAEDAAVLMSALEFMATRFDPNGADPDDERTKPQRMVDALVQLAHDVLAGSCSHCQRPSRPIGPAVQVTVALSTLLGLDLQAGELNGQPVPAELAIALAHDEHATWRRLVTDGLGNLVDYGRRTYRPPASLARHVIARDRTCRFPGCRRRAESCEVDHLVAWRDGGTTRADNLIALCSRHHHLKHEAPLWQVRRSTEGRVEWRTPTGARRTSGPATYPLDSTGRSDRSTVNRSVAGEEAIVRRGQVAG